MTTPIDLTEARAILVEARDTEENEDHDPEFLNAPELTTAQIESILLALDEIESLRADLALKDSMLAGAIRAHETGTWGVWMNAFRAALNPEGRSS